MHIEKADNFSLILTRDELRKLLLVIQKGYDQFASHPWSPFDKIKSQNFVKLYEKIQAQLDNETIDLVLITSDLQKIVYLLDRYIIYATNPPSEQDQVNQNFAEALIKQINKYINNMHITWNLKS